MGWVSGQAYSDDLRSRVLGAVDRGGRVYEIAPLFEVSVSYIYKALARCPNGRGIRRSARRKAGGRWRSYRRQRSRSSQAESTPERADPSVSLSGRGQPHQSVPQARKGVPPDAAARQRVRPTAGEQPRSRFPWRPSLRQPAHWGTGEHTRCRSRSSGQA